MDGWRNGGRVEGKRRDGEIGEGRGTAEEWRIRVWSRDKG